MINLIINNEDAEIDVYNVLLFQQGSILNKCAIYRLFNKSKYKQIVTWLPKKYWYSSGVPHPFTPSIFV